MKNIIQRIAKYILVTIFIAGCNSVGPEKNDNMENESDKLIVNITASFVGSVGYGDVYNCHVVKVVKGNLDEENITVTILAGDKKNEEFISSHSSSQEFEMACTKKNVQEPYSLMPVSGFVDKNRTSWEISYLTDLKK